MDGVFISRAHHFRNHNTAAMPPHTRSQRNGTKALAKAQQSIHQGWLVVARMEQIEARIRARLASSAQQQLLWAKLTALEAARKFFSASS